MKKLLILSGKGGTGKTTTAAAFIDFAKADIFADCDVDAPNLHLVTGFADATDENHCITNDFIGSKKAVIDAAKCTGCGKCVEHCKFDAVSLVQSGKKKRAVVNEMSCEGCKVCALICPATAISMQDDKAGIVKLYKNKKYFATAELKMGRGTSGKLVSLVKQTLHTAVEEHWDSLENKEIEIIDGSPGIGCPVISSVGGMDFVLVVTEPSLSGISDMKRVLKTIQYFGVKTAVCVNKADTCKENTKTIKKYCRKNGIPFAGTIPYDQHVIEAVDNMGSIAGTESRARKALLSVYKKVTKLMAAS
ncbi:MAG: 4Fe-4S binding protein [Treponema sp.]|jgi:MinD superfamily P-loop ATPase|nr:4Fe-4S binding protein [Treponema sp.]